MPPYRSEQSTRRSPMIRQSANRPWQPDCYILLSGIVCSPEHVRKVLSQEEARAAREATAAIYRMMKG